MRGNSLRNLQAGFLVLLLSASILLSIAMEFPQWLILQLEILRVSLASSSYKMNPEEGTGV